MLIQQAKLSLTHTKRVQDKRHQMMNDVRALCDAPCVPGLIDFVGAYHESDSGQASFCKSLTCDKHVGKESDA